MAKSEARPILRPGQAGSMGPGQANGARPGFTVCICLTYALICKSAECPKSFSLGHLDVCKCFDKRLGVFYDKKLHSITRLIQIMINQLIG